MQLSYLACLLAAVPALAYPNEDAKASSTAKSSSTVKSTSSVKSTSTSSSKASTATQNACLTGGYKKLTQSARFDNDPNAIPLVSGAAINLYDDIFWNGMTLINVALGAATPAGVVPNSPPNTAGFGPTDVNTIQQGRPSMTSQYDDSTIFAFDLTQFYFGIVLADKNGVASAPVSGSVTVTGIDTAGNTVGSQTFPFTVGLTQLLSQMVVANLDSRFRCLQTAFFQVNGSGMTLGLNATDAALIDTVSYTVYGANL